VTIGSPRDLRREVADLRSKFRIFGRRLSRTDATANAANAMSLDSAKRFRIAVFVTPLTILGAQVTGSVKWSSPMPSATYKVDAGMSIQGTALTYSITNQTADGCTVTFTAPILLAAGTIVVVLAISPAPAT